MTKPQALYRFFASDGSLLYVGISASPGARWKQHRDDKPWWSQVALVTLEPYPDRESVLEAERRAIIAEQPRYNVIHARHQQQPVGTTPTTWGVWAGDMPDDCHNMCAKNELLSIYYPYRWRRGVAYYQCSRGHTWTCGWGHNVSGDAPEHRGVPIEQRDFSTDPVVTHQPTTATDYTGPPF